MTTEQEHIRYVRTHIDDIYNDLHSRVLFLTVADSIPADMLGSNEGVPESLLEDDDWAVWKPVPSSISVTQVNQLEQEYRLQLPPLYRAFLQAYHLLEWQFANVESNGDMSARCSSFIFPSLATDRGLSAIRELMEQWRELINEGYIPFAIGEDGQGIVCFDTEQRDEQGDCHIVWITWDALPELDDESVSQRAQFQPHMQPLFPSFEKMWDTVVRKRIRK